MPPLPKRSRISGEYCFGEGDQAYRNAPTTESLSTGLLMDLKSQFNWTAECEAAFKRLKNAVYSSPILSYPQSSRMLILDTDASNIGIGAVLSQVQDKVEKVVEYFSSVLSKPEKNYCVTNKKLLAIVRTVEHFHKYLYEREFLI